MASIGDMSDDDVCAAATAFIWSKLPKEARQDIQKNLSIADEDMVRNAVHHGRKVIKRENRT
jgi:hypothetical protein